MLEVKQKRLDYIREKVIGKKYDVLGDGKSELELLDIMGTDYDILEATRMSFGNTALKGEDKDKALIKYLLKNGHTSPFEQVKFKFYIHAPIVVMNQWQRHRTWSYLAINEISRRYSSDDIEFYIPNNFRKQSESNKQGSTEETIEKNKFYQNALDDLTSDGLYLYKQAIADGMAKEQARLFLPAYVLYTKLIITVDAHNLMHFIKLRSDSHAQWEIRQYSNKMLDILSMCLPYTYEAFMELNNVNNS